ncbi:MAG: molybdopterin-synthase adenylyltransferase MoeB [Planctomycetota bacterium]|nr:molybdopterin-synthase adenylyltransferase MoeB [Planctomycetota bacterium]
MENSNQSDPVALELDAEQAARWLDLVPPPRLIDVRELAELHSGIVSGAIHIPLREIPSIVSPGSHPHLSRPISCDENVLIYCAKGIRSYEAMHWLRQQGYQRCASLRGGIEAWNGADLPLAAGPGSDHLNRDDQERYARHLTIPEVGEEGQAKLLSGRVLVIGGGGLGSPAALYLAAAGVGHITIADDDVVELSNLQRQVLYRTDQIGHSKAEAAAKTLSALNPTIEIVAFPERVTGANAPHLIGDHDVVLDGADNFETRFMINDLCVAQQTAVVHGSVYRFEGQLTVFDPARGGPCLRCLHPQSPAEGSCASCAEAGVLGVMPGIIGTIQAAETIKILLGQGDSMRGRLLLIDALKGSFRQIEIPKRPDCLSCGHYRG